MYSGTGSSHLIAWLLPPSAGYAVTSIVLLSAAVMIVLNAKLITLVRYVTRGGQLRQLYAQAFWFSRPELLRWLIKVTLFMLSFAVSSNAFFAFHFGARSCFYSNSGFQSSYFPWPVVLAFNCLMCLYLAFTSLPLYSLAVQMHPTSKQKSLMRYVKDRHGPEAAARLAVTMGVPYDGGHTVKHGH